MNNHETVHDLHLVAFLVVQGFEIESVGIEDNRGRRGFVFRRSSELQREVLKFVNGQARVDPKRYGDTLRSLRAMIKGHFVNLDDNRVYHGPRPRGGR